jgi:CMP-N,N'-diacetyllegionaminic acid synthase
VIALIPARSGSRRIPNKNLKLFGGKPLLAWTIEAALQSGIFDQVVVSTDDATVFTRATGKIRGQLKLIIRPAEYATDTSPDIQWVKHAFGKVDAEAFAILRPTSPFRTAQTIQRAYQQWRQCEVHSLRSVRRVTEHPGKQWWIPAESGCLQPLFAKQHPDGTPWHSSPTQTLPAAYIQTGGLEMAWTYVVEQFGTISGTKIAPFLVAGPEAIDLNTPEDWTQAEGLLGTSDSEPDPLLEVAQAAHRLNVCHETIRRWIRAGKLPATRLPGGYFRIQPSALLDTSNNPRQPCSSSLTA